MINDQIDKLIQEEIDKGIQNFKENYIDTQFEKNKLYAYLGKGLVDLLKYHKAYIAGGTITSLFSNREINDIDIYFRNEESVLKFLSEIWSDKIWIVSHTNKATQIKYDDIDVQLIHFQYFDTPDDIFETFDFTSCMGCFDFTKEKFILHPNFLKHNSQKILKFNSKTSFPIVSMLRVQKYENKGYKISKPEFIRIILTCMNLNISSYEELKEQMGGMYGVNYDKLFEDLDDEEFELEDAIDKIANIVLDEDYFNKPIPVEFDDIEEILDNISKKPKKILKVNDKLYKITYKGLLSEAKVKPTKYEQLDTEEYFKNKKFYKYVKKIDNKLVSYWDEDFEYRIGEEIEAVGELIIDAYSYSHKGKLHISEKGDLETSYANRTGSTLIEMSVKPEDFIGCEFGHITARKVNVLREVPKEEYDEWDNFSDEIDLEFNLKPKRRDK